MPDNTVLCRRKREEVLVTVVFIRGVKMLKSQKWFWEIFFGEYVLFWKDDNKMLCPILFFNRSESYLWASPHI